MYVRPLFDVYTARTGMLEQMATKVEGQQTDKKRLKGWHRSYLLSLKTLKYPHEFHSWLFESSKHTLL